MVSYTWDNYNVAIATVGQLTAWRNADVKLASAECIAPDTFISANVEYPVPKVQRQGRLGKRIAGQVTTAYTEGHVTSTHLLQTYQFGYWMKQTAGTPTTENTPAGYNTHALTLRTTNDPFHFGYHLQSELTSENMYHDFLGIVPTRREIFCSEEEWTAGQILDFDYAYCQYSGDDINPTHRDEGATGTINKEWGHFVTGGLGADSSALQYNSTNEWDIIGVRIIETNRAGFRAKDATGYATRAKLFDYDYRVELDIIPLGDLLTTVMKTKKESYAGNLALSFSATADATNDKITYAFNTLYMLPTARSLNFDGYEEKYRVTLVPYDQDSTFTETGIDSLDNDHFENP